ncbi:MAG: hypothetical protein HDR25_01445 [Lachnospiraceae bacterium]|nr:hypothetical protein [Lachnospiraceae bacterium]
MKKYEFTGTGELSEKAFNVYSNSDFAFYKDGDTFYGAYNSNEEPFELGAIEDVESFLTGFAEEKSGMKNLIGKKWEDLTEMQEDLECCLEGEVHFGDIQSVPFSPSTRRIEIYNDNESYMLDFIKTEDGVELIDVN